MSGGAHTSSDQQAEITKKIVRQWQHTAELLHDIHVEELRNLVYDPELVDAMLELGLLHAKPRNTSGLIEMQQYFIKWQKNRQRP
ncbi:MAG: hypothetical protein CVV41_01995 [Candidatus Riflebacteria bacterium HGW-Riflebacteria-1]|jgi:hypothetical protein|nr:MAG: hypothetical protein CVV41_01995 [Candidatus Riflebacteria bacterium HGW-Riflebacteria-1]